MESWFIELSGNSGQPFKKKKQQGEKPSTAEGQFIERPKYTEGSSPHRAAFTVFTVRPWGTSPGKWVREGTYITNWGDGGLLAGASLVGLWRPQGVSACSAWALWELCLPL